jgi:acetyl esterase
MQGSLTGLTTAYIETAEFDPCRDEGHAYAQALAAKGVEVQLNATKGTVHGFDLLVSGSRISKAAIDTRVQFLRACFRS